jgi:hypothetical protein
MLFRNRTIVRGVACFFLLETLTTLVAPSVSLAMMGPGQPEFTSYESGASPDLVNLTTGDFTYNIPVLDVPGPDRNFSLPLTYRAGIKLEQEASWVGLGWSMNAGAIARSLNGYPDDANGELMRSTYNQKITRGWNGGVPSVLELAWDVNTGHSGSASLIGLVGLGWSGGSISSGSLVGVHASKDGININAIEVVAAAANIFSLGAASSVGAMVGVAASQLGWDVATGTAASMILGRASSTGGALGQPAVSQKKGFLHTNYWVFYNDDKSEFMYGSLNFGQMSKQVKSAASSDNLSPWVYQGSTSSTRAKSPEFNTYYNSNSSGTFQTGPGADLYQAHGAKVDYWEDNKLPISVAHDDFSVMGGNVSGNIRPYRLEVGSLAFPYKGVDLHNRFATVAYLDEDAYKVPFRYENSTSNGYDYHQFKPSAATSLDPQGVDGYELPTYDNTWPGGVVLKDPSLYGSATRTAPARKGILNEDRTGASGNTKRERRFVQGKNIKWFTNDEINQLYSTSEDGPGDGSFLEVNRPKGTYIEGTPELKEYTNCPPDDPYCQPVPVYGDAPRNWYNNPWRVTLPGKGIGAFAITAEDGTTYHYSLPVYHYTQFSKSRQLTASGGVEGPGASTQTIGPRNWDKLGGGYSTTWLLTAITSSDYVDRDKLGTVDDTDWGGWVRFDYGKFANTYKWRQPYLGESVSEESYNDVSYAEGYKETYYLNSIRTRTHTALFLKSVRNDARSHYQPAGSLNLGIDESTPASSLRLDEIVLLTNDNLAKLKTENGIRQSEDVGPVIPAFSENTASNSQQFNAAELRNRDSYEFVLDKHDVEVDNRIRTFINQQALKRICFNYSYRLCGSTPNSFSSATAAPAMDESQFVCTRTGKLTLESLSTYGPANTKLTPDFKFEYGFNPDYQKDNWDGFGMYKSDVVIDKTIAPKASHQVRADYTSASRDGAAWSLTGITSPLGGKTRITYERDQYSKVSEYGLGTVSLYNYDCSNTFTASGLPPGTTLSNFVRPGDILPASGSFGYSYSCSYYGDCGQTTYQNCYETNYYSDPIQGPVHVVSVSGNTLTIDGLDIPVSTPPSGYGDCSGPSPTGASLNLSGFPINKNGGDIRVAAISTQDEGGHEYQVKYKYTTSLGSTYATSSGVISKEPAFTDRQHYEFEEWFDYPGTSVLYGKTTILRGLFRANNAADYNQKEEYAFQTPTSDMVKSTHTYTGSAISKSDSDYRDRWGNYVYNKLAKGYRELDKHTNLTTVNLGSIGQPLSIKKINRQGLVESSSTFEYSSNIPNPEGIAGQGSYTEGVMTNELLGNSYYRVNRSTKVYQPTILVATTTKTNGVATRSQEEKFDFYTGQVVESSFLNYLGERYRSKIVPAYTLPIYAAMGPASQQPSNRNMLTQEAASYMYKVRADGRQDVVSANVQSWNGIWNAYRTYDAGTDMYMDRAEDPRPIWRLFESYVWMSPRLNADGTHANFTDFDWKRTPLASQPPGWTKVGEFTRYDHYSKPLESKDINGQYVARKLGYGQVHRLVSAANARYTEVAYSGAEDLINQGGNRLHLGGEVRAGEYRNSLHHHTGNYSSQLLAGQTGFTYKAAIGREVRAGKYRLSCWVYNSDASTRAAQLYAQVDGKDIGTASIASPNTKQAEDWYLLNLLVDVPSTGQQLTVGSRHTGGSGTPPVYVDDFRFHPVTAPTTAYVYDAPTGQLSYVLDNDNLFTHYEYDAAGKAKRISKEVLTTAGSGQRAERVVKEYDYNFALMADPNWLPTGTTTWVQGVGGPTNQRQHEERDINPRSITYNRLRSVVDGTYPNCTTCSGSDKEWRNGVCVTRTKVCQGQMPDDCDHTRYRCPYTNVYIYQYSDGTQSAPFQEVGAQPCR